MADERKNRIKEILGEIPWTAEIYWLVHRNDYPSNVRYTLSQLKAVLPETLEVVRRERNHAAPGKKIFLFASMHYWLEHISMIGLALAGQGHNVTLGYYPYAKWNIPQSKFDIRRQSIYTRDVFRPAVSLMKFIDLFHHKINSVSLPEEIKNAINQVTAYDYMYNFQTDSIDTNNVFYNFRLERNTLAANTLYSYLTSNRPDSVIVPNGTVMEMGIAYQICRYLKIPVVTYEFGEQKQKIWLAQNDEIMRQNTDNLWKKNGSEKLTEAQMKRVQTLFTSRKTASLVENFSRKWQQVSSEGASKTKKRLGLDERPVILLATNVLGDSLTLGRQVFSKSMTEWIIRTIQYFIECHDVQLVVRIHPGEALVKNGSIYDEIQHMLPQLPSHIHVIGPKENVNTYDVMEFVDYGLVYTTTVGLELAMNGIRVEVAGQTHYRNRGFTNDPVSWVDYFKNLNIFRANPKKNRLTQRQIKLAWKYAYLFFYEYSQPFPWHMFFRGEDFDLNSMKYVFSAEGKRKYGQAFDYLTFKRKTES